MKVVVPAVLAALMFAAACNTNEVAEPPRSATIAFLRAVPGAPSTEPTFLAELRRNGFREGDNLVILAGDPDEAYTDDDAARVAVERWQASGVDLIVALSSSGARVAGRSAPDTNVLFLSNDPTATGLVVDERQPEGRLTGASFRVPPDRTLALAQRVVPNLTRVGLVYPPSDPAAVAHRDAVQRAADDLGLGLVTAEFADGSGVLGAVDELVQGGAQALLLSTSPQATRVLPETADAAAGHRLPVVSNTSLADFAVMALTPDTGELGRQLGRQAARLLNGADSHSVPVEDPNRFQLTLNAVNAAALGLTFGPDLMREADKVVR